MVCDQMVKKILMKGHKVLILVLMEYGLRPEQFYLNQHQSEDVLILVLMEYGLRLRSHILFRVWI